MGAAPPRPGPRLAHFSKFVVLSFALAVIWRGAALLQASVGTGCGRSQAKFAACSCRALHARCPHGGERAPIAARSLATKPRPSWRLPPAPPLSCGPMPQLPLIGLRQGLWRQLPRLLRPLAVRHHRCQGWGPAAMRASTAASSRRPSWRWRRNGTSRPSTARHTAWPCAWQSRGSGRMWESGLSTTAAWAWIASMSMIPAQCRRWRMCWRPTRR